MSVDACNGCCRGGGAGIGYSCVERNRVARLRGPGRRNGVRNGEVWLFRFFCVLLRFPRLNRLDNDRSRRSSNHHVVDCNGGEVIGGDPEEPQSKGITDLVTGEGKGLQVPLAVSMLTAPARQPTVGAVVADINTEELVVCGAGVHPAVERQGNRVIS